MDEEEDTVPEIAETSRTRTFAAKAMSFVPGKRGRKAAAATASEEIAEEEDAYEEVEKRSVSTFGRALSSFKSGKPAVPKDIDIWKPDLDAILGLTFEVPEDDTLKGVVVASIESGGLIARSKKLKVGDVLHSVNGMPVSTPEDAATTMRSLKGVILLLVTRANAKPKQEEGSSSADAGELTKSDKTRSFMPSLSLRPGRKNKAAAPAEAPAEEDANNTTVVVSCSALIRESQKIIGTTAGLDEKLADLYAQLKAKEIPSAQALQELTAMVGQTVVEQAGLVIASSQQGSLPEGWVEYFDKASNRAYYYNVHTKTTTWYKPRKDKPPPPPPPGSSRTSAELTTDAPSSARRKSAFEEKLDELSTAIDNNTSQGHDVSDAISNMATRKKLVETVQVECQRTPRSGPQGLQSVSL